MNLIVSLMVSGAKKRFPREEYKRIRREANTLFEQLKEENKDIPKALKKHTGNYHRYPAGMVKHSLRDFSPEAGFEYRMPDKVDPAVARFDIVSCPYHAMCKKYNCLELNPAFCDSDDAKYGNLHRNLKWARKSTIGHGAPCCDFRIIDVSRCPNYDG